MRRKLLAFLAVLLLASLAWAPPPRPTTIPPRPPVRVVPPAFHASMEAARARGAAEAAELLRQQSAATISRAQRAAMLNAITHDLLRQKQAASLAELRQLRADWVAVGPGAGLDPIVAMQLESAESAAERLLLAEVLELVGGSMFERAEAKLAALESPRYLPTSVAFALPELRASLAAVVPLARLRAALDAPNATRGTVTQVLAGMPRGQLPVAVAQADDAWSSLHDADVWLRSAWVQPEGASPHTAEAAERVLKAVEKARGAHLAARLRVELAARAYLLGHATDAAKLLEGEVDQFHAADVLADLRAAILGRGAFTTAQVAAFVPANQTTPPAQSVAVLPADQLAKWKPPTREPGETTVERATRKARAGLELAVVGEVGGRGPRVHTTANHIRAALAAEAAPLKAFWEKVEAAHGKPLGAAERQLAAIAGGRGMTVAEVVGVLAVEADRPASAARLLATVPVFANPAAFAASVEVSGRAPAGFTAHPDAAFKLTAVRDRARIREAVGAVVNAHAAKIAAGQEVPDYGRAALEADVQKRLSMEVDTLAPAEYVQAVLDVCRDWADEHARLVDAHRELNQIVANIEAGNYGSTDDELKEILTTAQVRRLSVQADKKRREVGVALGCQLLSGYGSHAAPALGWLRTQREGERPWRAAATATVSELGG